MTGAALVALVERTTIVGHGGQVSLCQPLGGFGIQATYRGQRHWRGLFPGGQITIAFAVGDPINCAGVIVGYVDIAVRTLGDVHGAAGNIAIEIETGEKVALLDAVVCPVQRHDFIAVGDTAVPGAVQRGECAASIRWWQGVSIKKGHAQRRVVRLKSVGGWRWLALIGKRVRAHIRIGDIIAIKVGPAVEFALFYPVEFAGWKIIAQHVTAVVRGIEVSAPGRPVETDAVAQACRNNLTRAAVQLEAHHGRSPGVLFLADIAG